MRICAAQTRPIVGDIRGNLGRHIELIDLAAANEADLVVFPELSLTGYEPQLAADLATDPDDDRLDELEAISRAHGITIGVGLPTTHLSGVCISMVLFQPRGGRRTYSKKSIHADEEEHFVGGENFAILNVGGVDVALAICYQLSVAEHAAAAMESGATIYVASVAKLVHQADSGLERLAEIASAGSMAATMSNCVGEENGQRWAGRSSVWNRDGRLTGQLDDTSEGIILIDTETQEVVEKMVGHS